MFIVARGVYDLRKKKKIVLIFLFRLFDNLIGNFHFFFFFFSANSKEPF